VTISAPGVDERDVGNYRLLQHELVEGTVHLEGANLLRWRGGENEPSSS
jgi:hypothetical protein